MKSDQKVNKSPYNQPPVKLRAQILKNIQEEVSIKRIKSKKQQLQEKKKNQKIQEQIQSFANQFYDSQCEVADKELEEGKPKQQEKQNKQIKKIQSEYDKISKRLSQLKQSYKDLDMDEILFRKKDEKKLKQIAEFLKQKKIEKKQFKKKMRKIMKSQNARRKIQEQMKIKQDEESHKKKIAQIRKYSQMIVQKDVQRKLESIKMDEKVEQFYQKFKDKKKLFEVIQQRQKIKQNLRVQKQRAYLQRHKQKMLQVGTPERLQQHIKNHDELIRDMTQIKQAQKHQKSLQIFQKNKKLKEKIFIGQQYMHVQEQEQERQKQKQKASQKLKRIKKYQSYVKENFIPFSKQNQNQQNQLQNQQEMQEQNNIIQIKGKLFKRVKQYKYLQGRSCGEIICNIPLPQTERQLKMQGNSYLEQLKLLPRKRKVATSLELSKLEQIKPKTTSPRIQIPKINRKQGKIALSQNAGRYQIQNLIKSLKSRDKQIQRKEQYMRINSSKKSDITKLQLHESLINNIQKKLNLLGKL